MNVPRENFVNVVFDREVAKAETVMFIPMTNGYSTAISWPGILSINQLAEDGIKKMQIINLTNIPPPKR